MKRYLLMILSGLFAGMIPFIAQAQVCPDPQNSSLQWGVPPTPWLENPYSPHSPQGEEGAKFVKASILVNGSLGQGVSCTYSNSLGQYSIWWQVDTKKPSMMDNQWVSTRFGYLCTQSIESCEFFVAKDS